MNVIYSAEAMRSITRYNLNQSDKVKDAVEYSIKEVNRLSVETAEKGLWSTYYDFSTIAEQYDLNFGELEKVTDKVIEYLKNQDFNYILEYYYSPDEPIIYWDWKEKKT